MKKIVSAIILGAACAMFAANGAEPIKFGNFENWVTRNIKESKVIGGKTKQVYEIAPNATINGDQAYRNQGGSPWPRCAASPRLPTPSIPMLVKVAVVPANSPRRWSIAKPWAS